MLGYVGEDPTEFQDIESIEVVVGGSAIWRFTGVVSWKAVLRLISTYSR